MRFTVRDRGPAPFGAHGFPRFEVCADGEPVDRFPLGLAAQFAVRELNSGRAYVDRHAAPGCRVQPVVQLDFETAA